ncbi:uncharacterized protein YNL011C isoform X1 [Primulina huaijiensis]|uniref:uncharacterized protein YNL011C isoform X1 n=1 Tax=Primulina huaijiensis TaxID=1492673 RepID=UPI003CC76949
MADSYLGPPLSLLSPTSCSPLTYTQNFPIPFPLFVSHAHSRNPSFHYSCMAAVPPFRTDSNHFPCSSASAAPNGVSNQPSLLVFSGGTAFNGVVEELKKLTTRVAHVLPVSDDGGSTAEVVRVLGGPAVGDIRSRCLRLSDQSTSEALAVRTLLGYRLPIDARSSKYEWYDIVEGTHLLWIGVSKPYRETIRAFLVYFQDQILRRSEESFCFSNGSIGNFFFAGARIFFQSLDAAIFLFSRVSDIPLESLVLPVISTNDKLTLGCELWDGTIIRGQNEISHPTNGFMEPINKDNSSVPPLFSRIKRVFYMSSEGSNLLHEVYDASCVCLCAFSVGSNYKFSRGRQRLPYIYARQNLVFPSVNPTVLEQLSSVDCVVFAMGSLFTSICPSLVLLRIGELISTRSCPKVLLLNGTHDRETSGFTASCFVTAITNALNRTYGDPRNRLINPPNQYINTIFVPKDGQIPLDIECLAAQGIFNVVTIDSFRDSKGSILFDPASLTQSLSDLLTGCTSKNVAEM